MKKSAIRKSSAAPKPQVSTNPIDDYLAQVPEPARGTLQKVCAIIRSAVPPGTTETISYGIPTFKYKGSLFGFAAFAKHCSLFPMSSSLVETFQDDLRNFQTSKGTIRFPMEKAPPAVLIKKLVKARIAEDKVAPKG